jgi:sugar phosphate isomerase/epimerase
MRFSACTVSIPELTPEEAVRVLAETGFDGIEWRVIDQPPLVEGQTGFWQGNRCTWPFSTLAQDAPRIRALTEAAGLAIANVGTYVCCDDLVGVETAMQAMLALGATMLRVRTPNYDGHSPYLPRQAGTRAQYRDVAGLAAQYGVKAVMETHNNTIGFNASAAARILDGLDPAHVGAIYDPGCLVIEGYEPYRVGAEVLGPYLAHIHLKSLGWQSTGLTDDGRLRWEPMHTPIDRGMVDAPALFEALHAVNYEGWVSFEDFCPGPSRARLAYWLARAREYAAR